MIENLENDSSIGFFLYLFVQGNTRINELLEINTFDEFLFLLKAS